MFNAKISSKVSTDRLHILCMFIRHTHFQRFITKAHKWSKYQKCLKKNHESSFNRRYIWLLIYLGCEWLCIMWCIQYIHGCIATHLDLIKNDNCSKWSAIRLLIILFVILVTKMTFFTSLLPINCFCESKPHFSNFYLVSGFYKRIQVCCKML